MGCGERGLSWPEVVVDMLICKSSRRLGVQFLHAATSVEPFHRKELEAERGRAWEIPEQPHCLGRGLLQPLPKSSTSIGSAYGSGGREPTNRTGCKQASDCPQQGRSYLVALWFLSLTIKCMMQNEPPSLQLAVLLASHIFSFWLLVDQLQPGGLEHALSPG